MVTIPAGGRTENPAQKEAPVGMAAEPRLLLFDAGRSLAAFAHAVERNHSVNNRRCNIYQYNFHFFATFISTN
jgi:hypothetical protein